jgi:hypothetical protein
VGLFQFLVGLYLILEESAFLLCVALEEEEDAILSGALLHYLVPAVLHNLQGLVFTLYHQYIWTNRTPICSL